VPPTPHPPPAAPGSSSSARRVGTNDVAELGTLAALAALVLMLVGSSVRPTRGGAAGVSVYDVLNGTTTWAAACAKSGVGHGAGVLAGAARLVLWHLLQPSVYLVALGVYWPDLGWWSRLLGGIVGAREAAYVALCLVGMWVQPAYLLVDVRATVRTGGDFALLQVLVYVLSPEKFVLSAVGQGVGSDASQIAALGVPLLDLCAIAALVVAIVPAEPFPPALLVGYTLTALAGVSFVVLIVDGLTCQLTRKWSERLQELV